MDTKVDNLNKLEQITPRGGNIYISLKRTMDIVGSLIILMISSPILFLIAIAIKLEDPKGRIIFKHMRVGKNGNTFPCLKFRSMFANAEDMKKNFTEAQKEEYAETYKLKNDPRITKVGRLIRKTSLDELPQLFNILKGDMSIVGPRPIVMDELDFYGEYDKYYKAVKPGLTGLWQVSGRSDTTYDERIELDIEYITTRSISKDIYIILCTVVKVLKMDGAC